MPCMHIQDNRCRPRHGNKRGWFPTHRILCHPIVVALLPDPGDQTTCLVRCLLGVLYAYQREVKMQMHPYITLEPLSSPGRHGLKQPVYRRLLLFWGDATRPVNKMASSLPHK
jgi:hypothetical protein